MEPPSLNTALSIDIAVSSPLWEDCAHAQDVGWIAQRLAPLSNRGGLRLGELSIALMDDAQMRALNAAHRGKDTPTNVLSFHAPAPLLGDIVLSFETLVREAEGKSVSFEAHLSHLLIHGFLHLQGYDHQNAHEAEEMEALEIAALAVLGIDNPYEIRKPK